jgi:predicted PurR-regulated permease PerM
MTGKFQLALVLGLLSSIYFLYSISAILFPFVTGMIIAYLLDPLTTWLERYSSRGIASVSALLLLFALVIMALVVVGPYLYRELATLLMDMPTYLKNIRAFLMPYIDNLYQRLDIESYHKNGDVLHQVSQYIIRASSGLLTNVWSSGIALVNLIALIVITPIVSFYLLRDWQNIPKGFFDLVPRRQLKTVRKLCVEIDRVLSGYIRGQLNVCLLLSFFYATGLSLIGLDHAILLGFVSGILTIVPYFGVVIGMVFGIIIALFQTASYMQPALVVLVFVLGQFIEGNFITPKLVGDKVGLHPAFIIFALLAGASLFGFVGILFAIPVTASLKILLCHLLNLYKKSSSYQRSISYKPRKILPL